MNESFEAGARFFNEEFSGPWGDKELGAYSLDHVLRVAEERGKHPRDFRRGFLTAYNSFVESIYPKDLELEEEECDPITSVEGYEYR